MNKFIISKYNKNCNIKKSLIIAPLFLIALFFFLFVNVSHNAFALDTAPNNQDVWVSFEKQHGMGKLLIDGQETENLIVPKNSLITENENRLLVFYEGEQIHEIVAVADTQKKFAFEKWEGIPEQGIIIQDTHIIYSFKDITINYFVQLVKAGSGSGHFEDSIFGEVESFEMPEETDYSIIDHEKYGKCLKFVLPNSGYEYFVFAVSDEGSNFDSWNIKEEYTQNDKLHCNLIITGTFKKIEPEPEPQPTPQPEPQKKDSQIQANDNNNNYSETKLAETKDDLSIALNTFMFMLLVCFTITFINVKKIKQN